ncbi:MAG: SDR family oxidoreductase [Deltaproteobacteria bacterium]|nr:SDR family oxidoreductase [Deltaproteobacteria bacterium]
MTRPLEAQIALVVGAGRGIGRAIAVAYAEAGAHVVVAARTRSEIEALAAEIRSGGGRASSHVVDIADRASVDALFEAVAQEEGGLDILVANAGMIGPTLEAVEVPPDEWERVIHVNLIGTFTCMRAAVPHLRQRGGGKIIVMGSGFGHRGMPGFSAYSASKAAVVMLIRVMAQELRGDRIAVNEIVPGPVKTSISTTRGTIGAKSGREVVSNDWYKDPEDVTGLALYLAGLPNHGPTGQSFKLLARDA